MYFALALAPIDILLILILVVIIGSSIAYTLYRRKKGLGCSSCSSCSMQSGCSQASKQ